tara:strand:- start:4271 stop:4441 length:171 start_codon:yes stop_codon:yes gene_type:complete
MENPSKKECEQAIDYFFTEGMIDNLNSDPRKYIKILLHKVAFIYNIDLIWNDDGKS